MSTWFGSWEKDAAISILIALAAWGTLYLWCLVVLVYRERKALQAEIEKVKLIITPLQLEGLRLAHDLRLFINGFGELGPMPAELVRYRTSVAEHFNGIRETYAPERDHVSIEMKVRHGFMVDGLEDRVNSFIHRVGFLIGMPVGSHVLAEGIYSRRSLALLAMDVDQMVLNMNYLPSIRASLEVKP